MPVIEVRDLHKRYGPTEAVRGISFDVHAGEVFALLGPNGAGKTTTVEVLEGHRARSGGHVSVLGHDPAQAARDLRDRIGIVLQSSGVESELTVREALALYGRCYRRRRDLDEVLALVGLQDRADVRIPALSGGQRRRVDLALGLIGDPEVLFLDEPTTGFDPTARRAAWDMLQGLVRTGTTVVLTTHYMDEVQRLADRVVVLSRGEIVAEGSPASLAAAAGHTRVRFRLPDGVAPGDIPLPGATIVGGHVEAAVAEPTAAVHAVTGWALAREVVLEDLTVARPDLESVYLQLVEEPQGGGAA